MRKNNKKELKKEVKTWLKEEKDIKIVDMDGATWIGVDSYHLPYLIFVSYCTMFVTIQRLSGITVNKIDFYDMNNNFRRMQ
mgnify:CR=1 FL=1